MKTTKICLFAGLLFFACQRKPGNEEVCGGLPIPKIIETNKIDEFIFDKLKTEGRFNWEMASEDMVWSALISKDSVLAIGYKPPTVSKNIEDFIDQVDIMSNEWKSAREQLFNLIYTEEKKLRPSITENDIKAYDESKLPILTVRIHNFNSIKKISNSPFVRYIEPMGYDPIVDETASRLTSDLGCGISAPPLIVPYNQYTPLTPFCKCGWSLSKHQIPAAWTRATGKGVKIMLIDTGISPEQSLLGSDFNSGTFKERKIEKVITLRKPGSWFGPSYGEPETSMFGGCAHGTTMAGVLAAPRTGVGNAVGIAYESNVVAVRASVDVHIDESREIKGVCDAFVLAANNPEIKIISMSMGRWGESEPMRDAIRYAFNKQKLVFCAGGTSAFFLGSWVGVIFPGTMDEVLAVTGVKDNGERSDASHVGKEIDFTATTQRASDGFEVLTMGLSGTTPYTTASSSASTATMAGIAALVWSRYPNWTRTQVIDRLRQSSENYGKSLSKWYGWGRVDADKATQ